MNKNNIRMVVQSVGEVASEFAARLEGICSDLSVKHKDKLNMPPIVFLTSASDGRQTATLQFVTDETDKTKEATSGAFHEIIERLRRDVEFEKTNNPEDYVYARTSWSNQQSILIAVKKAELIIEMYDKYRMC